MRQYFASASRVGNVSYRRLGYTRNGKKRRTRRQVEDSARWIFRKMLSRDDLVEAPCSRRLPRRVVQRHCSTLVGLTSGRLVSSKNEMIIDEFAWVVACIVQPRVLDNGSCKTHLQLHFATRRGLWFECFKSIEDDQHDEP